MKLKLLLLGATTFAILALVALLGSADNVRAGTFNPTLKITLADPTPEANSDFTLDFNVPEGDVNFANVVSFIPKYWGIVPGGDIPIGTVVGKLTAGATLGLINSPCNNPIAVEFIMLNASTDPSDTVLYTDGDSNGVQDYAEDKDKNGLKDGIEKYPDFITRVLVDENDKPLRPLRRAAGVTVIAGLNILLQFLIFEPGTVIWDEIDSDPELGYPTQTLLQNIGDPGPEPEPGTITDFCSPLTSSNTSYGISKDNACTDSIPLEERPSGCPLFGADIAEEGGTQPDESGKVLLANPKDAKYTFTTIALGQRDADGDGYENALDTCALVKNEGDPRVLNDGDEDGDGLDAACDPNDDFSTGGGNQDEDLDNYANRQDNCPLVANGEDEDNQQDSDLDGIGDACDEAGAGGIGKGPDTVDGEYASADPTQDVTIGSGAGTPDYPEGFPLTAGDDGDGGDGGGNSALIIIIVVVLLAVLVVGGGAALLMRRRRA